MSVPFTPTRIYVSSCLSAIRATGAVKALAHITGGGFPDNIPRALPKGLGLRLDLARVRVLPVFIWLAKTGHIAAPEMLRVHASPVFTPDPTAGREVNLGAARVHYQAVLGQLEGLVRAHPYLWFNFLPLNPEVASVTG